MDIKQISLIEPASKRKSVWSIIKQPRMGSVTIATILKNKGYNVKVFSESISPIDWDYVYNSDICGISTLTYTANEAYEISKKIKKKGIPVVFGGPHATILPEETLEHCDFVLRGEGEHTFIVLLDAFKKKSLEKVRGLSYKKKNKIIHNPSSDPVDIDKLPSPDLSLIHNYTKKPLFEPHFRVGTVLTSRGCPYNCEFCSVIKLFGRKYRTRSIDNVIKDIKAHLKVRNPKKIFFVDDNFIVNKKRTIKLLNKVIKNKFPVTFSTQLRASSATDENLVALMKKAGLDMAIIGFESINEATLNEYNKKQKLEEIVLAIKTLKKHKINIHGMFVFGSDNDQPDIINKTLKFCLEHGVDTIQFLPLTALPGTMLTERLNKENRIIDVPWNCYDCLHVNIFPKNIRPSTLQNEIIKAYKKFYSLKRAVKLLLRGNSYAFCSAFLGFFFIKNELKNIKKYIEILEKQEQGRYKGNTLIK